MQLRYVLVLAAMTSAALVAADPPYAGAWKLNISKSDFGGPTVTYRKLASGEWQSTADGQSYKFNMDGRDYPDGLGDMAAWKSMDAKTWQTTWKTNGKTVSTDTLRLGADGILTVSTRGTKPNGETIDDAAVFQRVLGGPGLAGKWKSKSVRSASPLVLNLVTTDANGLTFEEPAYELSCEGKLNGKDYPCSGPTSAQGWGVAMTKTGASSFLMAIKKDGKPLYRYTYTASPDRKTLTVAGGAIATRETVKQIYDRQ